MRSLKDPDVWIPILAACVGSLTLLCGWFVASHSGYAIASGVVSVLGLIVSAFVARTIWEIRKASQRTVTKHQLLRRVDGIITNLDRGIQDRNRNRLASCMGDIRAILASRGLHEEHDNTIQSIEQLLAEHETVDRRSTERIARQIQSLLRTLRGELEIHLDEERVL